ncbi:MAG: DUF45 domain-containing protein [Actinobacteria bacterium]|nr:DUF45 domain-containing protein [Actinomycetota bacterium]
MTTPGQPRPADRPAIEIRRSAQRRRTVSARREGDRFVVLVPARMSAAQATAYADELVARIESRERRAAPTDDELHERALALSRRWLPGAPVPASVRWVTNQRARWGSCTTADRTIRLSHRLRGMPDHVVDYVLLHELAHLLVPGHGANFEALLTPYPRLVEARAFLEGVSFAARAPDAPDAPELGPEAEPQPGVAIDDPAPGLLF